MSILSRFKKVKRYVKQSNGYQLLSQWTSSQTVEMDDGSALEDRISNVDNTSDLDKPISIVQQKALNKKVDKIEGKGLSTEDYTTEDKNKLTNLSNLKTVAFTGSYTDLSNKPTTMNGAYELICQPDNWKSKDDPASSYPDGLTVFRVTNAFGASSFGTSSIVYTIKNNGDASQFVFTFFSHTGGITFVNYRNTYGGNWQSFEQLITSNNIESQTVKEATTSNRLANTMVFSEDTTTFSGGRTMRMNARQYTESDYGMLFYQLSNAFQLLPIKNGTASIGDSSRKFASLYANNVYNSSGAITSSDAKKKYDIENISLDFSRSIINGLVPKSFRYKDGTSGRIHFGGVAQDLQTLLKELGIDSNDFAALVKDYPSKGVEIGKDDDGEPIVELRKDYDAEPDYYIRYEEFIMILVKYCQGLNEELHSLSNKIENLEEHLR